MIATISIQAHMSSLQDNPHSLTAHVATPPLSVLPRRVSSRPKNAPSSLPTCADSAPFEINVHKSTPERVARRLTASPSHRGQDSDSSSDSSDETRPNLTVRPRRTRPPRLLHLMRPPEQSTPTPAFHDALRSRALSTPCNTDASSPSPSLRPTLALSGENFEDNTPRPQTRSLIYVPGMQLRVKADFLTPRAASHTHGRASSESPAVATTTASHSEPKLIRKKSGQLVKPSLKTSKSRDSLTIDVRGCQSRSEPSTPTHSKAVHFDSKLEHVKLFLAEQKPLAVSRDGSPTEDTSGTDTEFPSFIYGDYDSVNAKKNLSMTVHNMPAVVNPCADVVLEDLVLSADKTCVLGKVRVRNIAYAKLVAVRFTFDSWQTTSEVTAKYTESLSAEHDRFAFVIRLNDLLARIEEKVLYLAVRYLVAGMEFWDNNGGNNYAAVFSRATDRSLAKTRACSESNMADLRDRLEKAAKRRDAETLTAVAASRDADFASTSLSLAARYDIETSLKQPWKRAEFTTPFRHFRTKSYPSTSMTSPEAISWPDRPPPSVPDVQIVRCASVKAELPLTTLGSPRDANDDARGLFVAVPRVVSDLEDSALATPAAQPLSYPDPHTEANARNHRRGCFDARTFEDTALRRTPKVGSVEPSALLRSLSSSSGSGSGSGSSPSSNTAFDGNANDATPMPASARHFLFPPRLGARAVPALGLGLTTPGAGTHDNDASDISTPSFFSSSSSSCCSSRTTTPSPTDTESPFRLAIRGGAGGVDGELVNPAVDYRQFLNKFCFFTGMEGSVKTSVTRLSRTQSVSDVEEYLTSASPRLHSSVAHFVSASVRSPSLDSISGLRSGPPTPTAAPTSMFPATSLVV